MLFAIMLVIGAWSQPNVNSWTVTGKVTDSDDGAPLPGVNVLIKGTTSGKVTDLNGEYSIDVSGSGDVLVFSFVGYQNREVQVGSKRTLDIELKADVTQLSEVVVSSYSKVRKGKRNKSYAVPMTADMEYSAGYAVGYVGEHAEHNTESYSTIHENIFHTSRENPLSTFSIDVDAASYSNLRRFLTSGMTPPKDAIRIEEMINYFSYEYPQPEGDVPFSITKEVSTAPWNRDHQLVHIGLQGREIPTDNLPASNLVFLVDVSGSMQSQNKLPLLKKAFNLLIDQLRPQDRVAIAVYAGAAGLVLESTPGSEKAKIRSAINNLHAGGSTAGGAGIRLAYKVAEENFIEEGNNRIILATDGDFNVGASSDSEMERLVEQKRKSGVYLTTVGFGMGNYKDSKMEVLANKGNGNYAYIDNILEAKKVFVNEFGGTLFTIAKDVKIQVEFNPAHVAAYRLIGYENRKLNAEDFNDDKKDAGEIGSGHTVTALYEIIPVGVESEFIKDIDALKYQKNPKSSNKYTSEMMTVKIRYKSPDGDVSKLTQTTVSTDDFTKNTSDNFRWSAAVAGFGMILRESEFKGDAKFDMILDLAKGAKGKDEEGYRSEFIGMIRSGELTASK